MDASQQLTSIADILAARGEAMAAHAVRQAATWPAEIERLRALLQRALACNMVDELRAEIRAALKPPGGDNG